MNNNSSATINAPIRIGSVSAIPSMLVALGIIFIGVREYFYPAIGALGFGVPLIDPRDGDLLAIKAARDIASGVLVLTVIALRDRRFLAYMMGVLTLIPILDGLIVLKHAGWSFTPIILAHWVTAAVMLIIVALLRMGR